MLEGIAVLTGGSVISEEVGLSLEEATLEELVPPKISITEENITVIDSADDGARTKGRGKQIL